ncbi:MAG: hypothetical protein AUG49_16290 [Catenulispora sp. 13_1_20CM_3_70_7]|nr:MAG: hypothetical protein AUG49_16290 [Catenulispora sp. 13_1_20CM_3_70_7]
MIPTVPDQPNHLPTRNGVANTDSTWMPPTSSRPFVRFGAPNRSAAGHSLTNVPTPISTPRATAVARLERGVTVRAATATAVTTRS